MLLSKFNLKEERRPRLYFNKYQYRVSIDIKHIGKFRYYKSYNEYLNYQTVWTAKNLPLSNKDEINRYFDFKDNNTDCGYRLEFSRLYVYSNDLEKLEEAAVKIDSRGFVSYFKAITPRETGTIEFAKQPQYKFRNYFKSVKVDPEFKSRMLEFIETQREFGTRMAFNPSMMEWISRPPIRPGVHVYISESWFVDYDDERLQLLFELLFGECLKPAVYRLVQRTATE